jgi:hypothetical protein
VISATLTKQPAGDVNINASAIFTLTVNASTSSCSLLVSAEGGNYTMNSNTPLVFSKTYTTAASNYIAKAQIVEPITGSSLTASSAAFNILNNGAGQLTCTARSTNGYNFVVPTLPATMQLEVTCNTAAILKSILDVGGTFTASWVPNNNAQTTITGAVLLTSAATHNLILNLATSDNVSTAQVLLDPIVVSTIQAPLCTLVTPANTVVQGQEMQAGLVINRGPVDVAYIQNIQVPVNNPLLTFQYTGVGAITLQGTVANSIGYNFCQKQVTVNAVPNIDSGWKNNNFISASGPSYSLTMANMYAEAQNGYKISIRPKVSTTAVSGYVDVYVTIRGVTSNKSITKVYPVNVATTPDFIITRNDLINLVNRNSYDNMAITENYEFKFEPRNRSTNATQWGYMGFRVSSYNSTCLQNLATSYASVYRAACEK